MRFLSLFLLFFVLGLVGALPIAIVGLLFALSGAGAVFFDIYWLGVLLLALWLPLKAVIDSRIKGVSIAQALPQNINPTALIFGGFALFFIMPILYFMNFLPLMLGIIAYNFSAGNMPIAILSAVIAQTISLYRTAQAEKASGTMNTVFMRFNEINLAETIIVDNANVQAYTPRPYEAEILNLPEKATSLQHEDEEVIYFDDEESQENKN